jgi:hypothetical protein
MPGADQNSLGARGLTPDTPPWSGLTSAPFQVVEAVLMERHQLPGSWGSWKFQLSSADVDTANRVENAKDVEQPDDHDDNDNTIKNIFDLTIHGDVVVNHPQQNPDDNQSDYQ